MPRRGKAVGKPIVFDVDALTGLSAEHWNGSNTHRSQTFLYGDLLLKQTSRSRFRISDATDPGQPERRDASAAGSAIDTGESNLIPDSPIAKRSPEKHSPTPHISQKPEINSDTTRGSHDLGHDWITGEMIPGAPGRGSTSAKGGPNGGGPGDGGGTNTPPAPYIAGESADHYNIELTFLGDGWTTDFYEQAVAMAELICDFITEDIADYTLSYRKGRNVISDFIDDIEINLTLINIDGTGGILGQAGPEYWRTGPEDYHLILEGSIELDTADALDFFGKGLLDDILFHEMLHVIGVGTLWSDKQVTSGYTYLGQEGSDAYRMSDFTGSNPLIEDDGGSGTAGGHWEEGGDRAWMTLDGYPAGSEIMTGYIDTTNWLSWVTIASLEDIGYGTIWDANRTGSINPVALAEITPGASITLA